MKSLAYLNDRGWSAAQSSAYDVVAEEYYDARRHPTCANFREASKLTIWKWLQRLSIGNVLVGEIGAGASIVAECLPKSGKSQLSNLLLIDASERMLAYSSTYREFGARLIVADAIALPLRTSSVGFFIISLGDPFNYHRTWQEVRRCLLPGGQCLYTTPSYEWAQGYRREHTAEREDFAFFELRDGRAAYLPSLVYPIEFQREIFGRAGLSVLQTTDIPVTSLRSPLSPKLALKSRSVVRSPVTAYLIEKDR